MAIHIGDHVPNFEVETTKGIVKFHDWIGDSWVFFFSHPADFTPVCTTEIGRTAQLSEEFAKRNTKPIGLSTDNINQHNKWIKDVETSQKVKLDFPIIADSDRKVAKLYDMIHPGEHVTDAVRTIFIIDPNQKLRLTMTYPMNVGRNFDEILRVIDALQLADANQIATPVDWQKGDKVIIPTSLSNEDAKELFPKGWNEVLPYLREVEL